MLSPWAFREQYLFTDKCNNNMKYNIQKIVLSRIGETQCFGTRLSISTIKSWAFKELPVSHIRSATSGEAVGQFSPEIFTNVLYLLGAATSYIILPPPENISWLRPCLTYNADVNGAGGCKCIPKCFDLLKIQEKTKKNWAQRFWHLWKY